MAMLRPAKEVPRIYPFSISLDLPYILESNPHLFTVSEG